MSRSFVARPSLQGEVCRAVNDLFYYLLDFEVVEVVVVVVVVVSDLFGIRIATIARSGARKVVLVLAAKLRYE